MPMKRYRLMIIVEKIKKMMAYVDTSSSYCSKYVTTEAADATLTMTSIEDKCKLLLMQLMIARPNEIPINCNTVMMIADGSAINEDAAKAAAASAEIVM